MLGAAHMAHVAWTCALAPSRVRWMCGDHKNHLAPPLHPYIPPNLILWDGGTLSLISSWRDV